MPAPAEISEVKAKSRAFREVVEACERGEITAHPDFDVRKLGQLGRSIAKRRENYARSIEGDA